MKFMTAEEIQERVDEIAEDLLGTLMLELDEGSGIQDMMEAATADIFPIQFRNMMDGDERGIDADDAEWEIAHAEMRVRVMVLTELGKRLTGYANSEAMGLVQSRHRRITLKLDHEINDDLAAQEHAAAEEDDRKWNQDHGYEFRDGEMTIERVEEEIKKELGL